MSVDVDSGPPICDYCGGYILKLDPECPARDEGVCAP